MASVVVLGTVTASIEILLLLLLFIMSTAKAKRDNKVVRNAIMISVD